MMDKHIGSSGPNIGSSTDADRVYRLLKDQIVSGERPIGSALRQESIAHEFETSRTPAREAMVLLASENLVDIQSGKGATVSSFSKENALALSQMRGLVECYAARRACRYMPDEVIAQVRERLTLVLNMKDASTLDVLETDMLVHSAIAEWSNNIVLKSTIERLREMAQISRSRDVAVHHKVVLKDLQEVLDAIGERDPGKAHSSMYRHIMDFVVDMDNLTDLN